MSATIDDRLLQHWEVSRRHQDEARRFLARQKLSDPRGESRALEEIVGTIADLEQTLRAGQAARRSRRGPGPPGPRDWPDRWTTAERSTANVIGRADP